MARKAGAQKTPGQYRRIRELTGSTQPQRSFRRLFRPDQAMPRPRPHDRVLMIAGVAALSMMAIAGRLAWLQLFQYSEYLGRAQRQQQRVIEVTPRRGAIYDRNLHPMAMSIPVDSCFAVPAEISDVSLASQLLSSVLAISREVIEARLGSSRSFVWIARKLPPEKAQAIQALNLKGIYFQKENQRFYPKRDLAAHVLGYVDLDEKGLGGIEYDLDNQILAKPEKILVMADAKRRWFDAAESQREPGASVVLTVDEKIQFIAERELAAAVAKTRAIAGTVIVQDPSNGQILAEASWPKFYAYIRAFGFGTPTGIDLPGESRGLLRRLENWTPVSIGSISMGQEIGVTPVQLICAVSAIANGGLLFRPRVVAELRRGDQVVPPPAALTPGEPRRVIRPETAATLRRLMEGVILNGTGKPARLDGWTAGGKTGAAQKIDPATGGYSRTQLIASFTGFAPISNPAVTILVSLDSPVGQHEGGQVAAPVFKRIAEQVLAYLDVPRDVPLNGGLMQAGYRRNQSLDVKGLEESAPVDFSAQPDTPPVRAAGQDKTQTGVLTVTVAVGEGGNIPVPDLRGQTM